MRKYKIKLISIFIICIFAIQPVAAFDDSGYWDDWDDYYDDWYDDYDDGNDNDDDWYTYNEDDGSYWINEVDVSSDDNDDGWGWSNNDNWYDNDNWNDDNNCCDEDEVDVGYGDSPSDIKDAETPTKDKDVENLETVLNKILEAITKSTLTKGIKDAMKDGRISVKDAKSSNIFTIQVKKVGGQWTYSVSYNAATVSGDNIGTKLVIGHEVYHIHRFENGGYYGTETNAKHHEQMVNDPLYKDMLKELIPGQTEDFYNKAIYAGTPGTPIFDNLTKAEQDAITAFFEKNGIH